MLGRWILERGGASADLQAEADFCRSTHGFFTSCSSTRITTSLSRSSRCRRRHIVDKSSPRLRLWCAGPRAHRISPRRASFLPAAHLHASPAQAMHPCTPPAPPRCILTASHIPRARPSALAPGRLQRAQSTAVAPTPFDAPLAADGHPGLFGYLLVEFSTLVASVFGLRAVFAFGFSESGVHSDRDVSGRRVPPGATCALLRGW